MGNSTNHRSIPMASHEREATKPPGQHVSKPIEILNQHIDDEIGVYRVQVGAEVHYLTIATDVFDEDTICQPALLSTRLPPFPKEPWKRMNIHRRQDTVEVLVSNKALPTVEAVWHCKQIDVLSLERVESYRSNVHEVKHDGRIAIAKIAAFEWNFPGMENETRVYQALEDHHRQWLPQPRIAPEVLAQLMEGDRVVGLLLEKLKGRFAAAEDFAGCQSTLQQLHALDVLHGDVNRYNFIVEEASGQVKLIDFEHAELWDEEKASAELESLSTALEEDSGRGGPPRTVR